MIDKLWFFHAIFSCFASIASDIFVCYDKSCYRLSLLVQVSIVTSVSRYDLVSFIAIILLDLYFMLCLGEMYS